MGIRVEYNPDLALRNISEHKKGNRKVEECIPEKLNEGSVYDFLKKDQRLYWLKGELPLLQTEGNEILSQPIASIIIIEATHFSDGNELWTKGKYKVCKVLEKNEVYFNGFNKIG